MPFFLTSLKVAHNRLILSLCHNSTKYILQNQVTETPQKKD